MLEPNAASLIPQKPPFVMIDRLLDCDEALTRTDTRVRAENIFVKNGEFREPGLIETIAQTAAARVGWLARLQNQPVPVGYIGAVNDLEIFALPAVGELLETELKIETQIFDVILVSGEIRCRDAVVARCKLKIFLSSTPQSNPKSNP
ncbi:MAG: 3-hydroxyacyl-ACP dehydratase [Sphingobacteriaceae bacterium]|nr:3-hydroxyacyl-ACP dehydratase [Cytophagaceae bacterium]